MNLTHIVLRNFRNYVNCEVNFPKPVNLIIGGNAHGKTSLLEAIYFLCTAESHRAYPDAELIRHNEAGFYLKGVFNSCDDNVTFLEAMKSANGQFKLKKNGVLQAKRSEWMGQFNVVFFSPESLTLVKGAPVERRRFLDLLISQVDRTYLTHLQKYRFVLKQRNELLKQIRAGNANAAQLCAWDELLVQYGTELIFRRLVVLNQLKMYALQKQVELTGGREKLVLTYRAAWCNQEYTLPDVPTADKLEESHCSHKLLIDINRTPELLGQISREFSKALGASQSTDLRRGTTSIGPHRDDVQLELEMHRNGFILREVARAYGSQGQQRTIALALKLAELEFIRETIGRPPIVLLDDVISELDYKRTAFLLDVLQNLSTQTFITATQQESFVNHLDEPCILTVENGHIVM